MTSLASFATRTHNMARPHDAPLEHEYKAKVASPGTNRRIEET